MARSYYSTIFEQSADEVWNVIRDFNSYPVWVDGAGQSEIEAGKSGDAVGAVRNVLYGGRRIRQQLLALSDADHSMTYRFAGWLESLRRHLNRQVADGLSLGSAA